MDWEHEFDWKIYFPEKRIYIMRQHNWAFASWEIEKIKGNLKNQSLLVHVDAHLDDTPDGVFVNGLHEAQTIEEIVRVAKGHDYKSGEMCPPNTMQIDNFIWASVARDTIGQTIFVSSQDEEVLSLDILTYESSQKGNENCKEIISKLPYDCDYKHQRFMDVDAFMKDFDRDTCKAYQTKILDVDLDYFNESDDVNDPKLKPIHQIRESLQKLRGFTDWDVITVAISPEYCGGNSEATFLLDIFLNEFELNILEAQRW